MIVIGIIAFWLVSGVLAVPTTFLLMLFLGNLGINLSFWSTLPGALVLSSISASASFNANRN